MKQKKDPLRKIKIITFIWAGIVIWSDYLRNLEEPFLSSSAEALGTAVGGTFWTIASFGVAYLCAKQCAKYAAEIKKSVNWAYGIGFFLSLLGLVLYWIYYQVKKK